MSSDSLEYSLYPRERDFIWNTLERVHNEGDTIIEIGSYNGITSSWLGLYCKQKGGQVYCIDPWDNSQDNSGEEQYKNFIINTANLPITPIRTYSNDVNFNMFANVSFIFVDGNHTETCCNNDMKHYYPLLKKGGVMFVHDVFDIYWGPNIKRAVDNFVNESQIDKIEYVNFIERDQHVRNIYKRDMNGGFAIISK